MALDPLQYVVGDDRPTVTVTVAKRDGSVANLSTATAVLLRVRRIETTELVATVACSLVDGGTTGKVRFDYSAAGFDGVTPGWYEAELEIDFDGSKQTAWERLKIQVRSQFG